VQRAGYITKDNVVEALLTDELIVQSYVYSRKSNKYWKILEPLTIELISNKKIINIERGFTYDMSSSPKSLWGIVPPANDGLFGYLVHDKLYLWRGHGMSRKEVDKEMLLWTNIVNKNKVDNYIRYFFVRLLGWLYWYKIV
jgi:hypothetical protein